jgi:hypothetical protein
MIAQLLKVQHHQYCNFLLQAANVKQQEKITCKSNKKRKFTTMAKKSKAITNEILRVMAKGKKPAAKPANVTEIGAKLAQALKAKPAEKPAADTGLGPNEKFPFGIKLVDAKGNISWERFKTAAERDKRNITAKGKRVDFALNPAAAEPLKPAEKPAKPAAAAPDTFALHLNKTGRLCIGAAAAERMGFDADKESTWGYMIYALDEKARRVRLEWSAKEADNSMRVRNGGGRPYVSATREFKPFGLDYSAGRDIPAKPYGSRGFEFTL